MVTAMVTAVHRPIFLERRVLGVLTEVAPPPPIRCRRRLSSDHIVVSGALAESATLLQRLYLAWGYK